MLESKSDDLNSQGGSSSMETEIEQPPRGMSWVISRHTALIRELGLKENEKAMKQACDEADMRFGHKPGTMIKAFTPSKNDTPKVAKKKVEAKQPQANSEPPIISGADAQDRWDKSQP